MIKDQETQAMSLRWINTFIVLIKELMLYYVPMILTAILPSLSQSNQSIRAIAKETNLNLYRLIFDVPSAIIMGNKATDNLTLSVPKSVYKYIHFDLKPALDALTLQFRNDFEETRIASMEWFIMLHKKAPMVVFRHTDEKIFSALFKTLSDSSDEVVKRDLSLLVQIAHHSDDNYFKRFILKLVDVFRADRGLLEVRGIFIFRQVCLTLSSERIFKTFAEILEFDEVSIF